MIADQTQPKQGVEHLFTLLPPSRSWKSVAVVVTDRMNRDAYDLARRLASTHGARIVLYDAEASSGWTSPFPPGEGIQPILLEEAAIRRSGRVALADAVAELRQDGVQVTAFLSTARRAGDLRQLVARERIDLVVCPLALEGTRVRNVHLARVEGAHLLICAPGERAALHAPLAADDPVPTETRIQSRFLIGVFLTFVAASVRNRARS